MWLFQVHNISEQVFSYFFFFFSLPLNGYIDAACSHMIWIAHGTRRWSRPFHVDYILCNSLSVTLSSRQTTLIQLERVISFRFR